MSDLFTVYLSNLNPKIYKNSKFNKFPLGKIIVEINNIKFTDLESFLKVLKEPVRSFKTVDNEIYYAEYSMTNKNEIINI
jgi:repressor of nif and glnA expression